VAGRGPADHHWTGVAHDPVASVPGVYDIWRADEAVVFVEIKLDHQDIPLGFPKGLLSEGLLGSMTIWPAPDLPSFIWWHEPRGIARDKGDFA